MSLIKKIAKSGKVTKSRPLTPEALFGRIIPRQPKLTPQRLFIKAQKILARFGKQPQRVKITGSHRRRVKHKKTLPKKYTDTRVKRIFPKGIKPLATHEKSFLRRYLMGDKKDITDIMWIHLSAKGLKYLEQTEKNSRKIYRKSLDDIAIQMRRIHNSLVAYGAKEISHNVPKDTGSLRWSLLTSMSKRLSLIPSSKPSDPDKLVLRVGFYTDLPYLEYVVKPRMIQSKKGSRPMIIAHSKGMRQRSRKTGEYLHDPNAKFGFMSLIRMHLKAKARTLTRTTLSTLSRQWGMTYNTVKGLFKYKGYRFT